MECSWLQALLVWLGGVTNGDRATGSNRGYDRFQRKRRYGDYNGDLPLVLDMVTLAQEQSLFMPVMWL